MGSARGPTWLVAFCDGITSWVGEGRVAHIVYLDFSQAFDSVSRDTLIGYPQSSVPW